ncbi:helix-turn-helix domain-containing protein [Brevibacillus massiliensis]|uniref:helix-turn-helix domain-containing protein n=1 Tax=Brevibacillus massiliensis TaxID=1118054 RepID=UPI0002F9FA39|nr:helix-turn-helix domain-containing protein [Brevibacillus massiliensis]
MSELGQVLQRAREEKGISLDEIQTVTKIQRRYLEAIERGHFHVLPGHFYARAFIKSYAEAVGLDANQVLSHFQTDLPAQPPQEQLERLRRRRATVAKTPLQTGKWLTQSLVVLFIVLVSALIYSYAAKHDGGLQTPSGTAVSPSGVDTVEGSTPPPVPPPAAPTPSGSDSLPANEAAGGGMVPGGGTSPDGTTSGGSTPPAETGSQQTGITPVSQNGSVYSFALQQADKLSIHLKTSNGRCWVEVYRAKNGKKVAALMMELGQEQNYELEKSAYIKLGDPKAVELTVNGQVVPTANMEHYPSFVELKVE